MTVYTSANPPLPDQGLRIMCEILRENEIDPNALVDRAGIDSTLLEEPRTGLTRSQDVRFQRLFKQATTHIPGVWFRTGQRYRVMADGPLGLAALTSANLTDSFRLLLELQELGCGVFQFDLAERDGAAVAVCANTQSAPADMREFLHERFLGAAPMVLRELGQKQSSIDRIDSVLDRPKGWLDLDEALGAEIAYGAAQTKVHLRAGVGMAPLPMANPFLADHYRRFCLEMIETAVRRKTIVSAISDLLMRRQAPFPTASEAAFHLNLSERSLHRKLAGQGTRYQSLLDNVRLHRARELLEQTTLSLAEISESLGFAEMASFTRFFRRLAGTPPFAYRRTNRERPDVVKSFQ